MPKNFFEDMVKVKRANSDAGIKKIPKRESEPIIKKPISKIQIDTKPIFAIEENNFDFGKPKNAMWFVAAITVIFFLFALSFLFARAKVAVNPNVKDVVLSESFTANKDSNIEGVLPFDLVVISGEENKTLNASEKKDVSESAKGIVIIYNSYNSASQSLDINTRLEASNGKIYKTDKKIVVPGKKSDGTPGAIEVGIYAEKPGEAYNSSPLDFKILGFKSSPKYEKFYARSKGDILGGLVGNVSVVSEDEKNQALISLKDALKNKLFKKATDQMPNGFVLFKDSTFLSITEENIDLKSSNNNVPISVKGTLYGFLFKEEELTQFVVKKTLLDYDNSPVYIPRIQDLSFVLTDNITTYRDVRNINFSLSGNIQIVSKINEEKLMIDILGKKRKSFKTIMDQYVNIDSADLSLRPIWKRTIPINEKHVKIIVNYPK